MKRCLLFFSILLIGGRVLLAQTNVYQPFPNDSAVWFYISTGPPPGNSVWTYIKWWGDTTINSISYTKTYELLTGSSNWIYRGSVRQDIANEKLYFLGLDGVETDRSVSQHLTVGDSITLSCPMVIYNIDSTLIGNNFHKVYNLKDSALGCWGAYIVGVGASSESGFEYSSNLVCFSVNNNNLIGTTNHCILASVDEVAINETMHTIFPNPFSVSTTVSTNYSFKNAVLTFYNSYGKQVRQIKNINGDTIILNRDGLPNGLYFVNLKQGNNLIVMDKLLIMD